MINPPVTCITPNALPPLDTESVALLPTVMSLVKAPEPTHCAPRE